MRHIFSVWLLLIISACSAFDPTVIARDVNLKRQTSKEIIVVSPRIDAQREGAELGFVAYMQAKEAKKIGAPNSKEFVQLLSRKVTQKEELLGHKLCLYGYKIGNRGPFVGDLDIWSIGFDCKP